MTQHSDFLIVGGGIIGLMTAWELQRAGASVTLLERGETGRESSWAGGGIVSPLYPWNYPDPVNALARWGQEHYPALAEEIRQHSGLDPEYENSGLLISLGAEPERAKIGAWSQRFHPAVSEVDDREARQLEPALGVDGTHWLWLAGVGQVRNPRLLKALNRLLQDRVQMVYQAPVDDFVIDRGACRGVRSAGKTYSAGHTLVCGGAWTASLLADLGYQPPIKPIRGQMLLFRCRPGALRRIVLHRERYLIPRRDGLVLAGSTLEDTGFVKQTTEQAKRELMAQASSICPMLASAPIESHWAGLRPGSPDGTPFIGPLPHIAKLHINAGHYRNGVVLGPASARLMADLLLQRSPILDPQPYLPKLSPDDAR